MKKILLLAICFLASTASFAQEFYGGPQAAFSITNMASAESNDKAGYQIGGFIGYEFGNVFGLELQAFYSNQGGANTTWDPYYKMVDHKLNLNYINVPLLGKFHIAKGFTGFVGPQVGFLCGANYKYNGNAVDIMELCNTVDWSIMMGLGYQFDFGLRVVADYSLGVNRIFKDTSAQNRVFSIKAGWRF